ncbi:MAG: heavy metal translocating P-type ATPase [Haloarculaceae archaeon]
MRACTLCSLPTPDPPVTGPDVDGAFCCSGCLEIYRRLGDVDPDELDVDDLESDARDVPDDTAPDDVATTYLAVDGMHCATCETFLESLAAGGEGIHDADASYVTETVRVEYDPERTDEERVRDRLTTAGYTARDRGSDRPGGSDDDRTKWRLIAGVVLGMWVMMPYLVLIYPVHFTLVYPDWMLATLRDLLTSPASPYFFYMLAVVSGIVVAYTGKPLLRGAYVSLRAGVPNMDLLVSLAAVSAYGYSLLAVLLGRLDVYFDVAVVVVVAVTAGNYYESSLKRKATDRLSAATTARVDTAHRYRDDGTTEDVAVEDLHDGDRVLVREGERIPVDGVVRDGEPTVDEAVVTGESLPVGKTTGDEVIGGSVILEGSALVDVGEGAESSVDRIAESMWNLQSSGSGVQRLADRLAGVFVPVVVAVAVIATVGYLAVGSRPANALLVGLTVLLVSCPCALGLATPLAVAASIGEALERGIVVFDDTVFERLRDVDTVVFDKTGTLTTGRLDVVDADAPRACLDAATSLERRSSHPIADAFVSGDERPAVSSADGESGDDVTDFRSLATGVTGTVDGTRALAGHPELFRGRDWTLPDRVVDRVETARADGHLPVVVGRDGTAEGVVVLRDEPREGWEETASALVDRGVEVVVLTGDDERAAGEFADHPAVADVFAGVPPEAKAETVRRLRAGGTVAMVGDGTNDAPALAAADLGVALGSGTAMAIDAADVAIVDDDLASLDDVFALSAAAGRRVKGNVGWALGYNAVAIPLAVTGLLNPLFASLAMAASSLLVVTNSTRPLLDDDA